MMSTRTTFIVSIALLSFDDCLCWNNILRQTPRRHNIWMAVTTNSVDEDAPAGIVGAEFFGGNKEKEEFFDPVAEAEATIETNALLFNRFEDTEAFADAKSQQLAQELQKQFSQQQSSRGGTIAYASSLEWMTPFSKTMANPLLEIEKARGFFRDVQLAITAAETSARTGLVQLRWELSVVWPIFWEPRVLITGTSTVSYQGGLITKQVDTLDQKDLLASIVRQWFPRFWDIYHIGMTPSAEISPIISRKVNFWSSYTVHTLIPRWYLKPSQRDTGNREDATASVVPNHSFSCIIRTMGPTKDKYVPTSPMEVKIIPDVGKAPKLVWSLPLSVEYSAQTEWTIPTTDTDSDDDDDNDAPVNESCCEYVWEPQRILATLPFSGGPQDPAVGRIREQLFQAVTRDGLKPKISTNGRPVFVFWQDAVKLCYTKEGLGMAVYEWRPSFTQSNYVGIELDEN